jgi:alpha-beta hydrolase superfamily lysophospholipase
VREQFQQDPLVFHDRFPVRTGAEALRATRLLRRGMAEIHTPLLVIHGTGDLVAHPRGSRELIARAAAADKTLRLYEGLYHECLSEPERDAVLADILAWLDARS